MKFTLEIERKIWDDEYGTVVEVGPDKDGWGCVEIRQKDKEGNIIEKIMFPPEQAILIGESMVECAKEMQL